MTVTHKLAPIARFSFTFAHIIEQRFNFRDARIQKRYLRIGYLGVIPESTQRRTILLRIDKRQLILKKY
jgi:hypothetical protein